MNKPGLRKLIGIIWATWSFIIVFVRIIQYLTMGYSLMLTLLDPDVWLTAIVASLFLSTIFINHPGAQIFQIGIALFSVLVMLISALTDQFGIVTLILLIYVVICYGYYETSYRTKIIATILSAFIAIMIIAVTQIKYEHDYNIIWNHVFFWTLICATFFACEIFRQNEIKNKLNTKNQQITDLQIINKELNKSNKKCMELMNQLKYFIDNNIELTDEIRNEINGK